MSRDEYHGGKSCEVPHGVGYLADGGYDYRDRACTAHPRVWATQMSDLTLEQQFTLKAFESQVERMSREQAQDFLIKLYEQMLVREAIYQGMLRKHWGIEQ